MTASRFNRSLIVALLFILQTPYLFAQEDYSWWVEKHNWNNAKPWYMALNIAPKYMGPNALPVPQVNNGKLPEKSSIKLGFEAHRSTGDDTNNAFVDVYFPLFGKRVGLQLQMYPYEHYKMDTITRDLRKARDYDGEGTAVGDIYVGTHIQLLENKIYWPDIALSINIKTASGMNLDAVRYTDTPGYFFDLSFGKSFDTNGFIETIRPHAMGGFYVYQTFHPIYKQNDCILYGIGTDVTTKKFTLTNALGGYQGYVGNGDAPMVYRATLTTKFNSRLNAEVRFQKGLTNYGYTSVRVCCLINLSKF